jgi:hypothetical protein
VVDEIATSAYISQQQRQQEAELILASPGDDVEATGKRWKLYTVRAYRMILPHPNIPITQYIWKFASQGKQENQQPGLLRMY